jgi:hypothetical protein
MPTGQSLWQLTGSAASGAVNTVGKIFSWLGWNKPASAAGKLAAIMSNPVVAGIIAICAVIAVTYLLVR